MGHVLEAAYPGVSCRVMGRRWECPVEQLSELGRTGLPVTCSQALVALCTTMLTG